MKNYISFGASLLALVALSACSDNFAPAEETEGEGRVMIKATVNSDVVVKTRAGETNDELAKSTLIWISNAKGAVYKFKGIDQVPAGGVKLLSGNYVAEAWAGDSVSASFDSRFFKGREEFSISKGSATQVNIDCKIANTLVSVEFTDKVKSLLTDISLEVGHDKSTGTRNGTLTFTTETPATTKGYYMTNSRSKDLVYTLKGKLASDGKDFEYSGRIANVARATEYHLIVKHTDQPDQEYGGAWITIEVDESEVEVDDTIEITSAPEISGIGFDLSKPLTGMSGGFARKSLWIATSAKLSEVVLQSDAFSAISELGGTDVELLGMEERPRQVLDNAGINFSLENHADTGFQELKLNFEEAYLNTLTDGTYTYTVRATDANGRSTTATFTVVSTDARVMANALDASAITTRSRSAVVSARVLREATNCGIAYRKKGTQQLTKVPAEGTYAVGDNYSVTLSGLEASTEYEFGAYCDNFEAATFETFTTDAEEQLVNGGMEQWCTDSSEKNVVIPGNSPSDFYWDSGNHGSITMNKNITTQESTLKHSGSYSAKLASQFVGVGAIGKFAAGNIFVGKYLDTSGTDGVLGWGRSFTSRPTAMRVWVKYEPAAVTNVDPSNTDGVVKGDQDKGIIYVALVDGTKSSYNSEQWPFIVMTKKSERNLFNKDGAQVVAYGEHVFDGATSGSGLVEVTIPIDYKRTDIRPSNIIVVASASKMGDFFTGGPSVMYVDDFELIYE